MMAKPTRKATRAAFDAFAPLDHAPTAPIKRPRAKKVDGMDSVADLGEERGED